jgi:hypothetical protein
MLDNVPDVPRGAIVSSRQADLAARSRALAGLSPGIEDAKTRAALLLALERGRPVTEVVPESSVDLHLSECVRPARAAQGHGLGDPSAVPNVRGSLTRAMDRRAAEAGL